MVTRFKAKNNPYIDYVYEQILTLPEHSDFENFKRGYKLFDDLIKFSNTEYTTLYIAISAQLGEDVPSPKNVTERITSNIDLFSRLESFEYNDSNSLYDKIGNVLLMHQIVEVYLQKLCELCSLYVSLKIYPDRIEHTIKKKKGTSFKKLLDFLEMSIDFYNKDSLIKECIKINETRNGIAHDIFSNTEDEISKKCTHAHYVYQKIRLILHGESYFDHNKIKSPSEIIKTDLNLEKDELAVFDCLREDIRRFYKYGEFEHTLQMDAEDIAESMEWKSLQEWEKEASNNDPA